jgi:hypothetical protein
MREIATCEVPQSQRLTFSAALAKVKFQGGSVVRCEDCLRPLRVAFSRLRSQVERSVSADVPTQNLACQPIGAPSMRRADASSTWC